MSINTVVTTKFTNNLALALQQKTSKLAQYALQRPGGGEMTEIIDLVQNVMPQRQETRFEAVALKTNEFLRRWAPKTAPYWDVRAFDAQDQLMVGIDLAGGATQSLAAMIARSRDMAFLEGFYGVNYSGKTGQTLVPFSASNVVAVNEAAAGPVGLTVDKLVAAKSVLRRNFVDLEAEECFMAITSKQEKDLLREVKMTSADYNHTDTPVLREGRLIRLLGFNFICMEYGDPSSMGAAVAAMTVDGSGYRRVPFWAKSGMAVVTWEDMFAQVSERADTHYAHQAYARTTLTASRTEEGKCGQVLCAE